MMRTGFTFVGLSFLIGCATGPEPITTPPIAMQGASTSVRDLLARARIQATQATEAFYLDNWERVVSIAQSIEETAGYLTKADVSADRQTNLRDASGRLAKQSQNLRSAASQRDANAVSAALTAIGQEIRTLQASFGATISEGPASSMP